MKKICIRKFRDAVSLRANGLTLREISEREGRGISDQSLRWIVV